MADANEVDQPVSFDNWDAVALESTEKVPNVLVCKLCSCTIKSLSGQPSVCYKSLACRARLVREPRAVLRKFGPALDRDVENRVWDIKAETGYIAILRRPPGNEGRSETELASIVTKNCLIGVALPEVSSLVCGELSAGLVPEAPNA